MVSTLNVSGVASSRNCILLDFAVEGLPGISLWRSAGFMTFFLVIWKEKMRYQIEKSSNLNFSNSILYQ